MPFAFSWELPATTIGALAVFLAAIAAVVAIVRAHHGPSHLELIALAVLALVGFGTWSGRAVLAQRLFPDETGVLEESIASQILNYSDCAAFVMKTGKGRNDGVACIVRVLSLRGRYVALEAPRKSFESPCDVTSSPEVREWSFAPGTLRNWCAR